MENRCQSNRKMFLSSLAISTVMEKEFSHIPNENKILHFYLSYRDKKLDIVLDFFHPLPPVSSQPHHQVLVVLLSEYILNLTASLCFHTYHSCVCLEYCDRFCLKCIQ